MNSKTNTFSVATVCALAMLVGLHDDRGMVGEPPAHARAIQPDPELQRQLTGVMQVLTDQRATLEEQFRAVGSLSEAARDDERFFRQLLHLYWQVDASPDRQEMKQLWTYKIIAMLDISRKAVAKTVIPFLDAQDERQRSTAKRFLALVEETGVPDCLNFSYFEALLQPDAPLELARYMYQRSPGTALKSFARVYADTPRRKTLAWAEHVVADALWKQRFFRKNHVEPDAMAELEKLSKDDTWWVRLYVAEILRLHPAARGVEVVERLKHDPHELVRQAMSFTQEKPVPQPAPPPAKSP